MSRPFYSDARKAKNLSFFFFFFLFVTYVLGCHLSVNKISSYSSNQGGSQEHMWRRGKRRRRRTTDFWPFWHRCKMAVTWFYATLLISICSFCRWQHADVNIWSFPLFFRFSGLPKSALIAILQLWLLLVTSLLILGYDATASSNSSLIWCLTHN